MFAYGNSIKRRGTAAGVFTANGVQPFPGIAAGIIAARDTLLKLLKGQYVAGTLDLDQMNRQFFPFIRGASLPPAAAATFITNKWMRSCRVLTEMSVTSMTAEECISQHNVPHQDAHLQAGIEVFVDEDARQDAEPTPPSARLSTTQGR